MRLLLLSLAVGLGTAGCASFNPPPAWDKGELAKPAMQFDPNVPEATLREHIYFSKEGAAGGYGIGGGGCGCN